jgi:hypothetical protein
MKAKCSICKARSVQATDYRGRLLCAECHYEYKAIFEGWQSNKNKKAFNVIKAWNLAYGQSAAYWDKLFKGELNGTTDDGVGS